MSRIDAHIILTGMGFKGDADFDAKTIGNETLITWLSAQPQPSDADLDIAAPSVYAAIDAEAAALVVKEADKADFLASRQVILDDITAIIASQQTYIDAPVSTNAARDAQLLQSAKDIKQLAKDMRKLVNAVKGLL